MFEAGTYSERRKDLAERMGSGVLLFVGNDLEPMNYADNPYPFWQDRSFLYYWGLDEPGLAGLIDAESGAATLFGHDQIGHRDATPDRLLADHPACAECSLDRGVITTA